MRTTKTFMTAMAGAAMLFTACDVKDPIYETNHPDKGKITLTTTWGATNITAPPAGGMPGAMPLDSDLTAALADFNDNKREPKALDGELAETPTETGSTATINGWKPISGGSVVAN